MRPKPLLTEAIEAVQTDWVNNWNLRPAQRTIGVKLSPFQVVKMDQEYRTVESLGKLAEGAREWLTEQGWEYDEEMDTWQKDGHNEMISNRVVSKYPNEIYALTMKIEGDLPWFVLPSEVITFR